MRPYDGCRVLNFGALLHLAPEGRHVYRKPHTPNNQSPRGATCKPEYGRRENWKVSKRSCMRRGWVPQPAGRGDRAPTMGAVS